MSESSTTPRWESRSSCTAKPPAVSVILPTYNQARFLPDALAGLEAQTFRDFEVIACDDGSDDGTFGILVAAAGEIRSDLRFDYHEQNRGTAAAINTAAGMARGRYWTWVSSDNVMHPDWLETLVGEMERTGAGAVYSGYIRLEDDRPQLGRPGHYHPDRLISSEACYFGPSFLIRADVWQEHRGQSSHDYDSWLRVEEACWAKGLEIRYVDKVLCTYRVGDWNTGRRFPERYDAPKWREEALRRRERTLHLSS